jgi:protein associated with RNAse G/E
MRPGDAVWVRVFKADGSPYRWWKSRVESITDDYTVIFTEASSPLSMPTQTISLAHHFRTYFWPGRRHTLLEIYEPDGRLHELYADITSPVEVNDGEIRFIDHELDVSMIAGNEPRIVDQDEFAEAAERFGYSDDFIRECYALAESLLEVLANWQPRGVQGLLFDRIEPLG